MVRSAIRHNINSSNFAFWIHTVRRKTNLDDMAIYEKLLPANIHNIWRRKNYWDDKFVNTLYISIIYDSAEMRTKNFTSVINSLFYNVVRNFQNKYLDDAHLRLSTAVDKILVDLEEYGAVKLGIRFEKDQSFSDPLFLYRRITHLNEDDCLVPISDLSNFLATQQYAVGSDKIEVITDQGKKFAAMLTIKEYQEISAESLDTFLQSPVELIATEVFYFTTKKNVVSTFEDQNYILKVSGDNDLRTIKGIARITSDDPAIKFCRQQISVAIIGDNLEKLDSDIQHASLELSKIGIVHVREDINLEQTFWAQLPANFTFLRRMAPTTLKDTAALTSLHNFPTGNQMSPWGRAITLLRTEKGTPYFMNFHCNDKAGSTCIFGTKGVGKTVATNFFISEATKYNPTILYLANSNNSKIFIEAIEGKWIESDKNLINPFLCEASEASQNFIYEFLKIICNHYVIQLNEGELAFVKNLSVKVFELEESNRNLSNLIKASDFSSEVGESIKLKLSLFNEGAIYNGLFDCNAKFELQKSGIIGYNLNKFSDQYFNDQFFPNDKKLIEQFNADLNINSSVRTGIIFAMNYFLNLTGNNPKILSFDDMDSLLNPKYFYDPITNIFNDLEKNNGIILGNINLSDLRSSDPTIWHKWIELIDTKLILPSDVKIENLDQILELTKPELDKLLSMSISSRKFLIKQGDQSIVAELSIGGLTGIVRILSAGSDEFKIYDRILAETSGSTGVWIEQLYKELEAYT
jgi:type IV secretion system protein VirB4